MASSHLTIFNDLNFKIDDVLDHLGGVFGQDSVKLVKAQFLQKMLAVRFFIMDEMKKSKTRSDPDIYVIGEVESSMRLYIEDCEKVLFGRASLIFETAKKELQ